MSSEQTDLLSDKQSAPPPAGGSPRPSIREDEPIENRIQFAVEVVAAVAAEIGPDRTTCAAPTVVSPRQ